MRTELTFVLQRTNPSARPAGCGLAMPCLTSPYAAFLRDMRVFSSVLSESQALGTGHCFCQARRHTWACVSSCELEQRWVSVWAKADWFQMSHHISASLKQHPPPLSGSPAEGGQVGVPGCAQAEGPGGEVRAANP